MYTFLQTSLLFLFPFFHIVAERRKAHAALPGGFCSCDFFLFPEAAQFIEILRQHFRRAAEADAPFFCRSDAFCLAAPDIVPFILRHEGQYLEDDVAEEGTEQVFAPPCVEKGHVDHHDVDAFSLCQHLPLLEDVSVIPAEPVDALDIEQVPFAELPHHSLVLGTAEIFAGLFVHVHLACRDGHRLHGGPLPRFILFPAAHPDVSVDLSHHVSFIPPNKKTDLILSNQISFFLFSIFALKEKNIPQALFLFGKAAGPLHRSWRKNPKNFHCHTNQMSCF